MDKELQEIFRKKNKEILITNLKYDLDKNIGSLMETISNIFNLEFDTAVNKLDALFLDSNIESGIGLIDDVVGRMKIDFYETFNKLIEKKKKTVLESIDNLSFEEDKMNIYYEMILNTTKSLKEELKTSITESLYKNSNIINNFLEDKIDEEDIIYDRLEDYLNNRLYGKLETKIHMEIMLRDNNLINKAKEGYLRYQDICSKTENK